MADSTEKNDPQTTTPRQETNSNLEHPHITQELQIVFDNAPSIIFFKDLEGRYTLVNHLFENLNQLNRKDIIGKTDRELYSEQVARKTEEIERQVLKLGKAINVEEILHFGDEKKTTLTSRFLLKDTEGKIYGLGSIATDVSELKHAQDSLEESNFILARHLGELEVGNREVKLLLEIVNILYDSHSLKEAYEFIEGFWKKHFKVVSGAIYLMQSPSSVSKCVSVWGQDCHPPAIDKTSCKAYQQISPLHVQTRNHKPENCCSLPEKGASYTLLCLPLKIYNEFFGLLHLGFEQKASKALNERDFELIQAISQQMALALSHLLLLEKVLRDPLTDLFNTRFMIETLERELGQVKRTKKPISVLLIDIDHFKVVNEKYGYDVGDKVLCEFVSLLKDSFRTSDLICRYGGEEFVIIMPNCPLAIASERATQFHKVAQGLTFTNKKKQLKFPAISIGVAASNKQISQARELIHLALSAVRQAKNKGGASVVVIK